MWWTDEREKEIDQLEHHEERGNWDLRVKRRSLLSAASHVTESHSGSIGMHVQRSALMSEAHITTREYGDVAG